MRGKSRDIINAASEVFLSKGFAAAGVDEIAAVAGVSKRTLYKHFGSKENLLGAIIVHKSASLAADLDLSARRDREPAELLHELAINYVRLILAPESLDLYRLVIAESTRFPDLARAFHENGAVRLRKLLAANLVEWRADGIVSVDDPDIAADQFLGSCAGSLRVRALFQSVSKTFPASIDKWVEAAVARFLVGVAYRPHALAARDRACQPSPRQAIATG